MSDTTPSQRATHWLYRRENLPKLWLIQIAILVLALLPEFFVHHHAHFPGQGMTLDTSWGFYAWYGFVTCAGMVALAKVMGIFLKRPDDYYEAPPPGADDQDDGVRDD